MTPKTISGPFWIPIIKRYAFTKNAQFVPMASLKAEIYTFIDTDYLLYAGSEEL